MLVFLLIELVHASTSCRFAKNYNVTDVLSNDKVLYNFLDEYIYWENQFINTPNVSVHPILSTTLDGQNLDYTNGTVISNRVGSAASKEALHFMYLAQYINNSKNSDLSIQLNIINTKLQAFEKFNQMFPGFGGFIPWFTIKQTSSSEYYIAPTNGWSDKTPALDNGEMYWGIYALKWSILQNYDVISKHNLNINTTLSLIEKQLNLMERNVKLMFYAGNGLIRWSPIIGNVSLSPTDPNQKYTGGSRGGDPFEGELFQWLVDLKSNWNISENPNDIWTAALPHLHIINYTFVDKDNNNKITDIIVQEGWHFSAHEQWKLLQLPYLDSNLMNVIFENCEKVRTLNSVFGSNGNIGCIPGMYADVSSPIANYSQKGSYLSAGIPSISTTENTTQWTYDAITPYSTMSIWLFNQSIAASWLLNMIKGPAMQNIYGTTKSVMVNGSEICPQVGWDAKITTVIGVNGGTSQFTKYGLKQEGLYDRFINVMEQQYKKVFGDNVNKIKTNHEWVVPNIHIPTQYLNDFTTCK
eukprot:247449_1